MTGSGCCIIILTLERHKDGIWIRRLVDELHEILDVSTGDVSKAKDCPSSMALTIEVRSLEQWMGQGWSVSNPSLFSDVAGIINRVSDAAPPSLFKACLAILMASHSLGIPTINGPTSFIMCGNKWCQHVLFQQAGLQSPLTKAFYNTIDHPATTVNGDSENDSMELLSIANDDNHGVLVKPNAGGFGAGITKVLSQPESLPFFEDGISLLQQYVPPNDHKLYRIWFLNGRVQCAVERTILHPEDEFTGACAGSTCSTRTPSSMEAYAVPEIVQQEIETHLLPLLPDAQCGSVEYLISDSGERLYFDLNLLSTLPVRVSDPKRVWSNNYNPWKELAQEILATIQQKWAMPM